MYICIVGLIRLGYKCRKLRGTEEAGAPTLRHGNGTNDIRRRLAGPAQATSSFQRMSSELNEGVRIKSHNTFQHLAFFRYQHPCLSPL